jgi:hypothetical protein
MPPFAANIITLRQTMGRLAAVTRLVEFGSARLQPKLEKFTFNFGRQS